MTDEQRSQGPEGSANYVSVLLSWCTSVRSVSQVLAKRIDDCIEDLLLVLAVAAARGRRAGLYGSGHNGWHARRRSILKIARCRSDSDTVADMD